MPKKNILLGHFLIEQGFITREQLKKALRYQKETGKLLGRCLIELGYVGEEEIIRALSEQMGVQYVPLKNYKINPEAVKLVPEKLARLHKLIPLFKVGKTLTVGMANPLDVIAIDAVSHHTGLQVEPRVCSETEIEMMIARYYGSPEFQSLQHGVGRGQEEIDEVKLRREAEEGPVVKLVDLILHEAIKQGASHVHIEPREKEIKVRFRIDGLLHEAHSPPKGLQLAIVSRIKILSGLDIMERQLPQDGRFRMKIEGREVDFRVSIFPTVFGENVVIRVLDKGHMILSLEGLGLSEEAIEKLKGLLSQPYGVVLVTGPTGSGKTTTLYAILTYLDTPEKNILTLEDPVEYHLDTIRQSQIKPDIGLTFTTGLRSLLRQDPDIVLIGEIRDLETAEMVVQLALKGRMVLSTLYTNDAPGALTRLMEMGVEPFLISSTVQGIIAQRLLRKICPHCKQLYKPSPAVLRSLGMDGSEREMTFYRGRGCQNCKQTGYKGRVGIYEVLIIDDEIKELVFSKAHLSRIKKVAVNKGMKTLRQDGIQKALQGITTLEEVFRVT